MPGRPRLVKYRTLESFKADYKRLEPEYQVTFRKVVSDEFATACDAWAASSCAQPARVRSRDHGDDLELRLPDGRAPFMLVREGADWIGVWRRIGDHSAYRDP